MLKMPSVNPRSGRDRRDPTGLATSSNLVIRFRTETQVHDARDYFCIDEVEVLSSN